MVQIEKLTQENMEDWNEALFRVEDYLRAHRFYNMLRQNEVATKIIRIAKEKYKKNPHKSPVSIAMEELQVLIDSWFEQLIDQHNITESQIITRARLAVFLTVPSRLWSESLLSHKISNELLQMTHEKILQTGPELEITSMVPRNIDFGPLATITQKNTWEKLSLQSFILSIMFWIAIFVLALLFFNFYYEPRIY